MTTGNSTAILNQYVGTVPLQFSTTVSFLFLIDTHLSPPEAINIFTVSTLVGIGPGFPVLFHAGSVVHRLDIVFSTMIVSPLDALNSTEL